MIFVIETIDNFFRWLKSFTFVSDLIIRLVVIIIIGGLGIMGWFISIPIFAWYFYKKLGNARIKGCRCNSCNKMNDCNDKFCISCGSSVHGSQNQRAYQEPKNTSCSCTKCNTENDCNDNFCINCGSEISFTHQKNSSGRECSKCYIINNCNDKFCTNCGSRLEGINSEEYSEFLNSVDGIVVALLSKIAKADGRISQEEATYLSSIFDRLAEKRDDEVQAKKIYKEILKVEKDRANNIDEFCEKLSYTNAPKDLKIEIVKIFMELAYIDSIYDKNEENIIVKIVHHLDLDFSIYQDIKNEFESKSESDTTNLSLDECYEVLESSKSDTMITIKNNYRRLVKQYHYDSLTSKDLPQDILKFAEEKAKVINGAYEKIKKSRN